MLSNPSPPPREGAGVWLTLYFQDSRRGTCGRSRKLSHVYSLRREYPSPRNAGAVCGPWRAARVLSTSFTSTSSRRMFFTMALPWFRFYDEVVDDPKVQRLAAPLFKAWVNFMCIANKNPDRGVLPELEDIAFRLHVTKLRAEIMLNQLILAGLFEWKDGICRPHNWTARQFQSDIRKEPEKPDDSYKGKYVYFIGNRESGIIKIGFSKNPWARIVEFQVSSHEKLAILATFRSSAASEADLHVLFSAYHKNGEWFELPPDLMAVVREANTAKATYEELLRLLRSRFRSSATTEPTTITDTDTDTETDTETEKKNPPTPRNGSAQYSVEFEAFWTAYPRKTAKGDAWKAWRKLKPDSALREAILAGIDMHKRTLDWQRAGGQFVPYPASWLNKRRWEDTCAVDGDDDAAYRAEVEKARSELFGGKS